MLASFSSTPCIASCYARCLISSLPCAVHYIITFTLGNDIFSITTHIYTLIAKFAVYASCVDIWKNLFLPELKVCDPKNKRLHMYIHNHNACMAHVCGLDECLHLLVIYAVCNLWCTNSDAFIFNATRHTHSSQMDTL